MQIHDKQFELYIKSDEIQSAIERLAKKINSTYKGEEVVFLGILNGAFMFAGELLKWIDLDCEISFIKLNSYVGSGSSGQVHEVIGLSTDLTNKNVVVVEDIVDTGLTLEKLYSILDGQTPKSLSTATLLFKPEAFKGTRPPKFVGIEIENKFIVGYGMDYSEKGRNLKDIYKVIEK